MNLWLAAIPKSHGDDYLQRVNNSWDVTQDGQENIDQKVCIASPFKKHANRRENDGEDDLDDITVEYSVSDMFLCLVHV